MGVVEYFVEFMIWLYKMGIGGVIYGLRVFFIFEF